MIVGFSGMMRRFLMDLRPEREDSLGLLERDYLLGPRLFALELLTNTPIIS